jgi:F-type H+-transporting ATPase subunit gamma
MKMVSAAKLKGDEQRLAKAKPFNSWTSALNGKPVELEFATFEEFPNKVLLVPFTSDKGLCGGVNSYITRGCRNIIKKIELLGKTADIIVIGDKGRAQLGRTVGDKITRAATDVAAPGTFALAAALTTEIMAAGAADYDAVVLVYNSFVNAAVYKQMYKVVYPFKVQIEEGESLSAYEFDSDKAEAIQDLYEFMLASEVFYSFMDGAASEQSSRMTAMENATQNAGAMINSLTLRYNRARQARITTELIEIISGASALEGK